MKRLKTAIIVCLGVMLLQSCSAVKVKDSWKSDSISNVKDSNFLVVARTSNKNARIAFENEIVDQMKSEGRNATASFTVFGDLKINEEPTEAHQKQVKSIIEEKGFNAVVLTVMKDLKEETRVQQDGGYYSGGNYLGYYPRYYGGFYGFYRHPMSMTTLGNYVPETITTSTAKLYILETTVYDLTASEEEQLVAVVTSELDNPESATAIASDYVKKITASLK